MLPADVTPLVLSANPLETRRQYQVEACNRGDALQVWQVIRQSQAFIWGGGSLIQDATSALSPLYYMGLMGLAQSQGLTTIAWAQGIGPLRRRRTRWLARRAFAGCTAISVRDPASAKWIDDWHLTAQMAPDPVWNLAAQPVDWIEQLSSPKVAVVLRSHPQLTPPRLTQLTQALLDFQSQTHTHILLVPFQASQDLAIAQSIHARLPSQSSVVNLTNPRQLKGLFQSVQMTIAMRLHGLIMAAAAGNRCFALSYDPKVEQFMQDVNCPGYTLEQLPPDPQAICRDWVEHLQGGRALSREEMGDRTQQALTHQQFLHQALAPLTGK